MFGHVMKTYSSLRINPSSSTNVSSDKQADTQGGVKLPQKHFLLRFLFRQIPTDTLPFVKYANCRLRKHSRSYFWPLKAEYFSPITWPGRDNKIMPVCHFSALPPVAAGRGGEPSAVSGWEEGRLLLGSVATRRNPWPGCPAISLLVETPGLTSRILSVSKLWDWRVQTIIYPNSEPRIVLSPARDGRDTSSCQDTSKFCGLIKSRKMCQSEDLSNQCCRTCKSKGL